MNNRRTENYLINMSFLCGATFTFCGFDRNGTPIGVDRRFLDGTQKQYIKRGNAERIQSRLEKYYGDKIKISIQTIIY